MRRAVWVDAGGLSGFFPLDVLPQVGFQEVFCWQQRLTLWVMGPHKLGEDFPCSMGVCAMMGQEQFLRETGQVD